MAHSFKWNLRNSAALAWAASAQPIGVLYGAALPCNIQLGEVDVQVQALGKFFVGGEFSVRTRLINPIRSQFRLWSDGKLARYDVAE
jgi:hypothetical protein